MTEALQHHKFSSKKEFSKHFYWLPITSELFPALKFKLFHLSNLEKKLYMFNVFVTTVL